ncbi:uncharacterized protein LOC131505395 [Neofelis nebulosa]|uniref:uncharacterized protein LOC131505395 n=1 Tax=Neofelis nebulosa TaxID=61452 RepID=UPI00272A947A|nr:uncharacterized protein LOC131505395 [Neofelis nebulosa]
MSLEKQASGQPWHLLCTWEGSSPVPSFGPLVCNQGVSLARSPEIPLFSITVLFSSVPDGTQAVRSQGHWLEVGKTCLVLDKEQKALNLSFSTCQVGAFLRRVGCGGGVVATHGACLDLGTPPTPAPPWTISASSETSPVIFLLPSIPWGKAELKLGAPQTEPCRLFQNVPAQDPTEGGLCNIRSSFFLFICLRGRGVVARSPGDFPSKVRIVALLATFWGACCPRASSLVSMCWRQLDGGGSDTGEPSLSRYAGTPEGPLSPFCVTRGGASPLSHPALPRLGMASSFGDGDGLRGCGARETGSGRLRATCSAQHAKGIGAVQALALIGKHGSVENDRLFSPGGRGGFG